MRRESRVWPRGWAAALMAAGALMVGCGGDSGEVQITFPVQVSVDGNGRVTSPSGIDCGTGCSANIPTGTAITLTAVPAAGHRLQGWGGACASATGDTCTVNVTEARSVTATFVVQVFRLDLAVTGSGRVTSQPAAIDCGSSCSGTFAATGPVVLTAAPAAGQVFQGWGGACAASSGPTCTLTLMQDTTVSATFAAQAARYTLGVTVTGSGSVVSQPAGIQCGATCSASFDAGTDVVLQATAAQGQAFQGWGGACSGSVATCTVNMAAARSATATFAAIGGPAPAWGTAVLLESSDDFNVTESGLVWQVNAISPNGDAMVIWQQPDGQPNGSVAKVYSRMYIAGQGWLPAVQVPGMSDFANRQLVGGRLFIDTQRVATWIRPGLDTRRFTPSGNWSAPFFPPTAPSGAGQLSSAVMDASGNIDLVTVGSDVYHLKLAANGTYSAWTRVDASGALNTDAAGIARSADGSAIAIWVERNPGDSNDSMKAARYTAAGGWQAPVTLDNSFDDVDQNSPPRVAMDASGRAIAVWEQSGAVQVATFSPAAGWSAPTAYDAGALSTQDIRLRVAMADDGRAVVAWQSGLFAIKTISYTPGSGFAAQVVATPYALDRELGIDDQGNAQLVYVAVDQWPNPTSTEISVYARQMPWGQPWGAQALLETQPGGIKTGLAVAFNRAGAALATWAQNDTVSGVRNSLWANVRR